MFIRHLRTVFAATALSAFFASTALAGDFLRDGAAATWSFGGVVVVSPEYEGSKSYQVRGFPLIFPSSGLASKFVDVRGADDVRFKLLNNDRFEAGPLVGYRFDRDEDDGDRLVGLGDVEGGFVVGGFARFALIPSLYVGLSYHRTVSGDVDGGQLRFGLEYMTKLSPNVTFSAHTGATYADDEYMDAYFGVTAAQAARSAAGLNAFNAEAGIKDIHFGIGTTIALGPRWSLGLKGRYSRLLGDAADSPVIETEDQFSGSATIKYKLGKLF